MRATALALLAVFAITLGIAIGAAITALARWVFP